MPTRDIRTRLVLDGEREFNQAMKSIEREARILTSEMGKLEAQYELTGAAQEYYASKNDVLTKQIEQQEIKVKALQEAVEDAAKKYGEGAKQTDGYRIKLNNAEKALIRMRIAQKDNEEAIQEYEKATRNASAALEDSADAGNEASGKMKKAFSAFSAAASGNLGALIEAIDEMTSSMGASAESVDADAMEIDGAMAGVAAAAAAVVAAIVEIGAEMKKQRKIMETEAIAMEIALGVTGEEAENLTEIGRKLYVDGFADSLEQAIEDLRITKAYMRDLDEESLDQITQQAQVLAKTTNADIQNIMLAAAVMREEFGTTAQETMDILVAVMQKNPFRSDELLDAMREYSVQFQQMGYSAEEMANLYALALENNVNSIDAMGRAFQELSIRSKDNSETTSEALKELGIDAETAMQNIAMGGTAAKGTVEQILDRLYSMPDALKRNEIGVALMASGWEDVGAKAILAAQGTQDALEITSGAMTQNVQKFTEAATEDYEKFYRDIETKNGETVANVVRTIDKYTQGITFDPIKEHLEEMVKEAEKSGVNIGESVVDGTINGLKLREAMLQLKTESIFEKMFNGVKNLLGIQSPSKLYEQLGAYSGEGYVLGLEKSLADAEKTINMVLTPSFETATAPTQKAGNVYNDNSQIIMKVDDVETFVAIKRRMETERVSKRMGYAGR